MINKNKILIIGLTLIILTGILFPFLKVHAEAGTCKTTYKSGQVTQPIVDRAECQTSPLPADVASRSFIPGGAAPLPSGGSAPTTTTPPSKDYLLLQPLPNPAGGGLFSKFDSKGENKIGEYLNLILKIFIGISAVLAVIMILRGGIEYMTSELISSKEEGINHIKGALLGLLLALGAWLLLNTINPSILSTDMKNIGVVEVDVTLMPETESADTAVLSDEGAPSGPTSGCPEGIGRTTNGISVCNNLVSKINAMIIAAKNASPSCVLVGGGHRSKASQIALRVKNCAGNTTDRNPNPACNPMTALPGASRHQQGLAIDFTKNGKAITSSDVCFTWLSANASSYGLRNLPQEPWHWSVDGK